MDDKVLVRLFCRFSISLCLTVAVVLTIVLQWSMFQTVALAQDSCTQLSPCDGGNCASFTCDDRCGYWKCMPPLPATQPQYPYCGSCDVRCLTCQPGDCGFKSDGCGGTLDCGCCPKTSCDPGECGSVSDGCGGTLQCGSCPIGSHCESQRCVADPPRCGDGTCTEHCSVCPQDCGTCTPGNGTSLGACSDKANIHCNGRCGNWTCQTDTGQVVPISCPACPCKPLTCQPGECGTKQDGCGGTLQCEGCPGGTFCSGNRCVEIPLQPCENECTTYAATCLTPCLLKLPSTPPSSQRANCAAYASMYPDQDNVCAYCDPGVCTTASNQAQFTCAPRGGTAQIICDLERNEWAQMVCSDGWQCTLDCDGDTHQITTADCGPLCPDDHCDEAIENCDNCPYDCGYCPSPANGLIVLTYNIIMLGDVECVYHTGSPCFNAERAPLIAEHLKPFNADVIVFQEAFDDSARTRLLRELASEYPYQTRVLNQHATAPEGPWVNGGVVIVSKWPIRYETDLLYSACTLPDCLGAKGVKYALIEKDGKPYHMFGTHTNSKNGESDKRARKMQLEQMYRFVIEQVRFFTYAAGRPILMAGDFNINSRGDEYLSMLSTLWAGAPTRIPESGVTNQSGEWIDYVLYGKSWPQYGLAQEPQESSNIVHEVAVRDGRLTARFAFTPNLSDHQLVRGVFLYEQAGTTVNTGGTVASASVDTIAGSSDAVSAATGSEACTPGITLAVPVLIAPAGDVDQDVQTFSWEPVTGAESYHLRVVDHDTTSTLLDVVIRENAFTPSAFAVPDRQYRWSVAARSGSVESPAAETQFTYRETAIPAPVALAPSGNVAGTYPRFSWNLVPGAIYVLTLSDAETGERFLHGIAPPGSFVTAGSSLTVGRRYRWTVQAVRGSRIGPESEPLEFTCLEGASLAAPEPVGPRGRVEESPAAFSWTAVPGAEAYRVDVVEMRTGTTALSDVVSATSLASPVSLPAGFYRWSVRAIAGNVAGPESVTLLFQVLEANRSPSVAITSCGECGVPCTLKLTAQATDPDGDGLSYSWSGCASGDLPTATCTLTVAGEVKATVTVSDGRGGTASAPVVIKGRSTNRPPVVSISGPSSCHPTPSAPCQVTLVASATDPDGDALTYVWSGCTSGSGATAFCTINDLTTRSATVQVSDGRGGMAQASVAVTGTNSPPSCVANGGQGMTLYNLTWSGNIPLTISDPDDVVPTCSGVGSDASHRISIGPYSRCKTEPTEFRVRPACANMPTAANLLIRVSDSWTTTTCSMPVECLEP